MIYTLIRTFEVWLTEMSLFRFVRVLTYVEFRAVLAVLLSFGFVVVAGRPTIRWLVKQKIGDAPEFYREDLNELMKQKANTPTMGGVLISGAIGFSTLLLADISSFYVQMALWCLIYLSVLGMVDDWLKLTSARRQPGSREGLHSWEKLLFQLGLAVLLGHFIHHYGATKYSGDLAGLSDMAHSLTLPLFKSWQWSAELGDWVPASDLIVMPAWAFVAVATVVIVGSSNAVNLTDGMDGLATGVMSIVAFALLLTMLAGWGDGTVAKRLLIPYIPLADELGVVAAAMLGACLGFLWFNCYPAQVFMGDTGSLPLGGLMGYLAVVIRQEFLLVLIGGIFVIEAISVMLQVGWFRFSGGRRIFRCAPIHHHFHLSGWTEQQVVVRFWLLTALFAAVALATLKLR